MRLKTVLVVGLALAAVASTAKAVDIGPYQIPLSQVVGKGPFFASDPAFRNDGTPPYFRKYFYRLTGAKLGVCTKREHRSNWSSAPQSGLTHKPCVEWVVGESFGEYRVGQKVHAPRSKPSLLEALRK